MRHLGSLLLILSILPLCSMPFPCQEETEQENLENVSDPFVYSDLTDPINDHTMDADEVILNSAFASMEEDISKEQ